MTYADIVNMPLPILHDLVQAKQHYDAEKAKAAQKHAEEVAKAREREQQRVEAKAKSTRGRGASKKR